MAAALQTGWFPTLARLFGLPVPERAPEVDDLAPDEDIGCDTPVFQPSAGRFFVLPDQQGDLQTVFDVLRAPVARTEDLVERMAAYVSAVVPAPARPFEANNAHGSRFEAMADMGGLSVNSVSAELASQPHVLLQIGEQIVDPMLGLRYREGTVYAITDRLWGGFPYAGLTLAWRPVPSDWRAPAPWDDLTAEDVCAMIRKACPPVFARAEK